MKKVLSFLSLIFVFFLCSTILPQNQKIKQKISQKENNLFLPAHKNNVTNNGYILTEKKIFSSGLFWNGHNENDHKWSLSKKVFYNYNSKQNLIRELGRRWGSGKWTTTYYIENNYDEKNNLIKSKHNYSNPYYYDTTYYYTYNNENKLTQKIAEVYKNNILEEKYKYDFELDSAGYIVESNKKVWDNSLWVNNIKTTYARNDMGQVIESITKQWNNINWVNSSRQLLEYNSDNYIVLKKHFRWNKNDSTWSEYKQFDYIYIWRSDTLRVEKYESKNHLDDIFEYNSQGQLIYHYKQGGNHYTEEYYTYNSNDDIEQTIETASGTWGDYTYKHIYNYRPRFEAHLDTVKYNFTFQLLNDSTVYPISSITLLEKENYFFEPIKLPTTLKSISNSLNILEGTRFSLDEDAIYEDISLDIRFMGMDNGGAIVNPVNSLPLFMFLGIEVTGEQSGVTSFEDYYKFNDGKKARICIPRTERFLELLDSLGIGDDEISFAFLKGGEYFEEGLEWEIKEGEEGKVDSLCLYVDHFSQIVGGKNLITAVDKQESQLPTEFSLSQNYPNPFNPSTTIKYQISAVKKLHAASQHVQLKVYDVLGKEVATLVNKAQNPGYYKVNFDANNLTSGIYYYQLKVGSFVETKKMIILK